MRHLTCLFACAMLLLTTWTGASHAADLITCTEPGAAEMVMHVGGACDDVGPDEHKAYPHHHDGCHGQHASTAAREIALDEPLLAATSYSAMRIHPLRARELDPTLRPPRA